MSRFSPNRCGSGAIGAVVGLAIGVVLAWWLAARRVRPDQVTVESQAHIDEDFEEAIEVLQDLVEHPRREVPPPYAASSKAPPPMSRSHLNMSASPKSITTG